MTRPRRHPAPLRRIARATASLALLAGIVAWCVLLRPQALGGPTAYVLVSGTSMEPSLRSGELILVRRSERYAIGEVIAYRVPPGQPGAGALVIHRIVGGNARRGFRTRGDNRRHADVWRPRPDTILGHATLRLPVVGRAFAVIRSPLLTAALVTLLVYLLFRSPARDEAAGVRGRRGGAWRRRHA